MHRFLVCLFASMLSVNALAHPHSWIQLTTDFAVDETGQLTELRQRWVFDAFYSVLLLADIATDFGGDMDAGLSYIGEDITTNLADANYFSNLIWKGESVALDVLQDYRLHVVEVGDDRVVVLDMSFALTESIFPGEEPIRWSVYDPTYYVSFMHNSNDYVRVQNQSSAECEAYIEEPEVEEQWLEYAQSLDRTQRDTDGLGEIFAEWVDVKCV